MVASYPDSSIRIGQEMIDRLQVRPGKSIRLANVNPAWKGSGQGTEINQEQFKARLEEVLEKKRGRLAEAQDKLYASDRCAVLVIFQGLAGADINTAIRHMMTGVNPQGCQAFNFSQPSSEDLDHNFLWRYSLALPERGRIGIFNHSYYDEVIYPKVNPEALARQKVQVGRNPGAFWRARYRDINNFERHLVANNIVVLKFFLHISKEEQRQRILNMIYDPQQRWRFSPEILDERKRWDFYVEAYEQAMKATSTGHSTWYVLPADEAWAASLLAAEILAQTILDLGLDFPQVSAEGRAELLAARQHLENEA
jgi:PPK2 family polyphosphate:nucleotide phosphotransferase